MLSQDEFLAAQRRACAVLQQAGIVLSREEAKHIEVADFGLGQLNTFGLEIVTYVNNDRYCAKELVLFPGQTCPEHLHPPIGSDPGKMETFRSRWGTVWLYVEGTPSPVMHGKVPYGNEHYFTAFYEVGLSPGEQHTIPPGTRHWFQAGPQGAVVSEFSSTSRDEFDVFTDPRIVRIPQIATD